MCHMTSLLLWNLYALKSNGFYNIYEFPIQKNICDVMISQFSETNICRLCASISVSVLYKRGQFILVISDQLH